MKRMLDAVHHLLFVLRWIRALGEIALLHAEDLTVFIRRRQNRFGPLRCRRIDDLPYQDCYTWFGHYPHNLRRLHRQLRVPQSFTEPRSLQMFSGEECFLVYLYHLTKGAPFTEMARFVFGGDPRRLSEMNNLFISHAYYSFYNKISGSSLDQWVPSSLNTCRRLIYDALSSDAIEEVEFEDGEVVDRRWILHHFDFSLVQLLGGTIMRVTSSGHFILGTFAVTDSRHRLCTYPLVLLGWCLLLKFGRTTVACST